MTNQVLGKDPKLFRIIDANLNRLKEGVRVVEDIARYYDNNKKLSLELKNIRHLAKINLYNELLENRDSVNDVLKKSITSELQRENLNSIITANYKRAQESARVLEEIFKLVDSTISQTFKNIRYNLYSKEKEQIME